VAQGLTLMGLGVATSGMGFIVQTQSGATVEVNSGLHVVADLASGTSITGSFSVSSGLGVVTQSGINVIVQSGLGIIGNIVANISGQPVSLTSGTVIQLSGLNVIGNFTSTTNISGQSVSLSSGTQVIVQSGIYTMGSVTSSISGQPISFVSGTIVLLSGLNVIIQSGIQAIIQSGITVIIASGSYVNTGIASNSISGQAVFISGTVAIQSISGLYIALSSGQQIATFSGEALRWSGLGVLIQSLSGLLISNTKSSPIYVASGLNIVGDITTSVNSGLGVVVQSGLSVIAQIMVSGLAVALLISGSPTMISGMFFQTTQSSPLFVASGVNIMGSISTSVESGLGIITQSGVVINRELLSGINVITQSTIASGLYVQISGQGVDIKPPQQIITAGYVLVGAMSGGIQLSSGYVQAVIVRALINNSGIIFVGGSINMPWYNSFYDICGFPLFPGDAITQPINNLNAIRVVSSVSGDRVAFNAVL
jgi:hypothetical protein